MISPHYPDLPGFKATDTSAQAAIAVATKATVLRDECMVLLAAVDLTADECAERLCKSVLSVRPRFAELKAMGLIFDSGVRRHNLSGHAAIVWTTKKTTPTEK